jgi:hypothetical protein
MFRSVKDLRHTAVNATDGRIGFVEQAFFDDEKWTIRYLVVDTDQDSGDRQVLISPMAVTSSDPEATGTINVRLTRRQVADSPDIDTEQPVSRQKELEHNRYFVLPMYWGGTGLWGSHGMPAELAMLPAEPPTALQEPADLHLRSSREVIGYRVRANGVRIGHIEDFLYDDASWRIRYIEVDTRNWIGGRHVLVPPKWAQSVSWDQRSILFDLPVEAVRTAPEYLSPQNLTPEFEKRMRSHYARVIE